MNIGGAAGLKGHVRSWGNNPSMGIWAMVGIVQSLLSQPWKAKETISPGNAFPFKLIDPFKVVKRFIEQALPVQKPC